jgi:hypothetical protein
MPAFPKPKFAWGIDSETPLKTLSRRLNVMIVSI